MKQKMDKTGYKTRKTRKTNTHIKQSIKTHKTKTRGKKTKSKSKTKINDTINKTTI
jgi:hypothetical protein